MPVAIPQVIKQDWGEELVTAFVPWLRAEIAETVKEKAVPGDEYREVLSRLDLLEKDISLVKEEQVRMRTEFREDLGELRREMHERFDRMHERFDDMHHQMLVQTRWLIGSLALSCTVSTGR